MLFGRHINRYYRKHLPWILLGILALIAVDLTHLYVPELYRTVVNCLNDGGITEGGIFVPFDMDFLLDRICLPLLWVILLLTVGRFLWRICFLGSAVKVETDLRSRMFDHCKGLSQEYYQSNKVGNLMSLFTADLETVQDCFGAGILSFFDALFLGSLALFKMARMHPLLTALCLIPLALMLSCSLLVGRYMTMKWEARQQAFSSLSDFSQESFAGIAVIKAFVKEAKELLAFQKLNRENEDTNVAYTKLSVGLRVSITLLVESVICIVLGYGGFLVYRGVFNPGQLVEFLGYFNAVVWPVMAVGELIDMGSKGKASLGRIGALLDSRPTVTDGPEATDTTPILGQIEFSHLTFTYPGERHPALSDVCLRIERGEHVGIIGKTGVGKTTLCDLLLRTYNIAPGTLFLDGRDILTLPIRSVRAATAYVPQDNFLFSDTIENNIAFASEGGGAEAVARAAVLSDVDENIRGFALGYQTVLGERGVTVSGGQKQRISIARALMKDAPILILDDAVSAVDVKTEQVILENLRRVRGNKTTLLIAHRISTVEHMDKVVLMDGGRILAVGTHAELCRTCAEYGRMVALQRLEDLEDGGEGGSAHA